MAGSLTLEDYDYAQKLRIYNDENRENVGLNEVTMPDFTMFYNTQSSTLQTFIIDVTTPSVNPVTVCTIKGGLTLRLSWDNYNAGTGEIGSQYAADFTIQLYDVDGNPYPSYHQTWRADFLRDFDQYPEHSGVYYYPPSFRYMMYGEQASKHPQEAYTGGCIITHHWKPVSLQDQPDFRNTQIEIRKFNDWYECWKYTVIGFDDLMALLDPDATPKKPDDDTSKPDDGDPDYDPNPDPVPFPDLPTEGDALSTGFITVYQPSSVQLQALAGQLWSDSFINTFRKAYNDPIEAIVSLHSIPFQVVTGTNHVCKIGNYDTNISMLRVSAQYYTINCGTIRLNENWASALDYAPYTQVEIYLPFVGVRPLNIDDIMNKNLEVKYNVDILTGGGVAMLKCDGSVLYTFPCEMSQDIPYTMSSKMQLYTNIAQLVVSGVTAAAAPTAGTIGAVASSAINVAVGKQTGITRGGTLGGNIGVLGDFTPYLIVHKPIQSLAADFAHKKGYPSNINATLSSLSGYTEIEFIHISNINCTDSERDEIERLLKEGVIL